VGSNTTLTAQITPQNNSAVNQLLVDIEIYDQNNKKVFQQFYDKQNWSAGETRSFSAQWRPDTAGTYRMVVGVFSNDWTTNYHWNDSAAKLSTSGSTPPSPPTGGNPPPTGNPPSGGTTNIWWPTDGATLQGVQPLKAMLEGKDVGSYKMFWQVDGGQLVEMFNSSQDYPHKEALVDFSGWKWKGSGPYTLNFVSKTDATLLGQKSVNIRTQ
jgi:hypothetical protein